MFKCPKILERICLNHQNKGYSVSNCPDGAKICLTNNLTKIYSRLFSHWVVKSVMVCWELWTSKKKNKKSVKFHDDLAEYIRTESPHPEPEYPYSLKNDVNTYSFSSFGVKVTVRVGLSCVIFASGHLCQMLSCLQPGPSQLCSDIHWIITFLE